MAHRKKYSHESQDARRHDQEMEVHHEEKSIKNKLKSGQIHGKHLQDKRK